MVKCNLKAIQGELYFLDKSLIFIAKQPVLVDFSNIASLSFSRYIPPPSLSLSLLPHADLPASFSVGGNMASSKTFDLSISLKSRSDGGIDYSFTSLAKDDAEPIKSFLSARKVKVVDTTEEEEATLAELDDDDDDDDMDSPSDSDSDGESRKDKKKSASSSKLIAPSGGGGGDDDDDESGQSHSLSRPIVRSLADACFVSSWSQTTRTSNPIPNRMADPPRPPPTQTRTSTWTRPHPRRRLQRSRKGRTMGSQRRRSPRRTTTRVHGLVWEEREAGEGGLCDVIFPFSSRLRWCR